MGTGSDGAFTFRIDPSARRILAGAAGHDSRQFELEIDAESRELRLGDLELSPASRSHVRVLDSSGRPVPGASVHMVHGDLAEPRLEGTTDSEGELAVERSGPVGLFATLGSSASRLVPLVSGPIDLVLEDGLRLGVVDGLASRAGIEGVMLDLESVTWPRGSWTLRSDPGGRFAEVLPRVAGGYIMRLQDQRWDPVPTEYLTSRPPGWNLSGDAAAGPDGVLWLPLIDKGELLLEVRSSARGDLLDGAKAWLESWLEPPFRKEPGWQRMHGPAVVAPGGVLSLHAFGAILRSPEAQWRVVVTAPGHLTGTWENRGQRPSHGVRVVRLQAAEERELRLVDGRGRYLWRPLSVFEKGLKVWSGAPSEGTVGPFTWRGDDISLVFERGPYRWVFHEVSTEVLASGPSPIVKLDADATLEFSVPDGVEPLSLHCVSTEGPEFSGRVEGRVLCFEQLPSGAYWLAPRSHLEHYGLLRGTGNLAPLVSLDPGQHLKLPWPAGLQESSVDSDYGLRVTLVGDRPHPLFAAPVPRSSSGTPATLSIGTGSPRFPVSASGTYDLPAEWSGRTIQIVFVRLLPDGQLLPVGWGSQETAAVDCGRLTLELGQDSSPVRAVALQPTVGGVPAKGYTTWVVSGTDPVDLGPVPVGTHTLRIQYEQHAVHERVEVQSGALMRLAPGHEPAPR